MRLLFAVDGDVPLGGYVVPYQVRVVTLKRSQVK